MESEKKKEDRDYTTISISLKTKAELEAICRKAQTYDDLIGELIKLKKMVE